jgi:hypothetical protein
MEEEDRADPDGSVRGRAAESTRYLQYTPIYTSTYLINHTAPSLCCFFCLAFAFSFLAAGLKTDLILRAPPRYSHVHTNTTAKLNMM